MHPETRIFIDISILFEFKGNLTGISRTIFNVLKNCYSKAPEGVLIGAVRFDRETQKYRSIDKGALTSLMAQIQPGVTFGPELALRHATNWGHGDTLLILGEQWLYDGLGAELARLKRDSGLTIATLIHDVVPFFSSQYYWDGFPEKFMASVSETIAISDFIFTNSKHTTADLISVANSKNLPLPTKIKEIRLGDHFFGDSLPTEIPAPKESGYILSVGTIQPRKNHFLLLYTWKKLVSIYGDRTPTLVLLGNRGWNVDNFFYFVQNDLELRERIVFKTEASDSELISYYTHARFTLFPSFYEGWGLPVAESLSLGKFCISSGTSSMPEIGGDLADYHDPLDPVELAELIGRYIDEPALLEARENRIRKEFVKTSWESTTLEILKGLQEWRRN